MDIQSLLNERQAGQFELLRGRDAALATVGPRPSVLPSGATGAVPPIGPGGVSGRSAGRRGCAMSRFAAFSVRELLDRQLPQGNFLLGGGLLDKGGAMLISGPQKIGKSLLASQLVLLDESLPLRAASILRSNGVDAIHAKEAGLQAAEDRAVLDRAQADGRACITLDLDFHQLLAETGSSGPSVVLLRFQSLHAEETARLVLGALDQVGPDLASGIAVTVTVRGLRWRRLPLKVLA